MQIRITREKLSVGSADFTEPPSLPEVIQAMNLPEDLLQGDIVEGKTNTIRVFDGLGLSCCYRKVDQALSWLKIHLEHPKWRKSKINEPSKLFGGELMVFQSVVQAPASSSLGDDLSKKRFSFFSVECVPNGETIAFVRLDFEHFRN